MAMLHEFGGIMMNVYDFTVTDNKGGSVSLASFAGKALLIVNTATGCGFTPQYSGLQDLYDKYKDKGLEILDFPCNQFGAQAPGTNEEISSFCSSRYGITFRQFDKIEVNGDNESPLYAWLKSQKGELDDAKVKWNFTKFLINKEGDVVARFAPTTTPAAIEKDIVKLLEE
jgi:glutathione peroxidase